MTRLFVVLTAAAIGLAGCVEDEPSVRSTDSGTSAGGSGASVGLVRGVVTDDSLLPLPGVDVYLDEGTPTTTIADGSFEFRDVSVGSHKVRFELDGFERKEFKIDVLEGQATQVRASLVPTASTSAYHESMHEAGVSFCGITIRDPVTNPNGTASTAGIRWCVLAAQAGQEDLDRSQIRWFFKFHNSSGFFSETFWSPSSAGNAGMDVIWTPLGDDGASTPSLETNCCGGSSESPLRMRVPIASVEATINNFTTQSCPLPDCMLLSYHYVRGKTLGPSSPADAGLGLQQRYDTWVTTFYNGPLPEEFTIRPEG